MTVLRHLCDEVRDSSQVEEGFVHDDGRPNRSDMIRNMLQYALRHRPKGWRP